jgi:hypothetical protein
VVEGHRQGRDRDGVAEIGADRHLGRRFEPRLIIRSGIGLGRRGQAERRNGPPGLRQGGGVCADVSKGLESGGADIDRRLTADGRGGPGGLEKLIRGTGQVVRPGADALGVAEQDVGARGHAVEQQLHAVGAVQQGRRQRLHALDRDPLGQLVENLGDLGVRLRKLGGPLAHVRGQQQLPARRRPQPGDRVDRPLVGHGEGADLLDLVTPELHPGRVLVGRREHVEDAAAHRELAPLGDQVDPRVGHVGQPPGHPFQLGRATGDQLDRFEVAQALELRLQQAADRRHDHLERLPLGVGEPAQHGQPAAHRVGARREALVRQRLPRGEDGHPRRVDQAAERVGQIVGLAAGGGHGEHRPLGAAQIGAARDRGDDERPQRGGRGEVERVGVDEALAREVTGAREPTVTQRGGNQAGELHYTHIRTRRITPGAQSGGGMRRV